MNHSPTRLRLFLAGRSYRVKGFIRRGMP